jgi:hypothetical protein
MARRRHAILFSFLFPTLANEIHQEQLISLKGKNRIPGIARSAGSQKKIVSFRGNDMLTPSQMAGIGILTGSTGP